MKRSTIVLLAMGVIVPLMAIASVQIYDRVTMEKVCPYEYGECPNPECVNYPTNDMHEYQVELEERGSTVYDHGRLVGFVPFDSTSKWDSLMIKDNE